MESTVLSYLRYNSIACINLILMTIFQIIFNIVEKDLNYSKIIINVDKI